MTWQRGLLGGDRMIEIIPNPAGEGTISLESASFDRYRLGRSGELEAQDHFRREVASFRRGERDNWIECPRNRWVLPAGV